MRRNAMRCDAMRCNAASVPRRHGPAPLPEGGRRSRAETHRPGQPVSRSITVAHELTYLPRDLSIYLAEEGLPRERLGMLKCEMRLVRMCMYGYYLGDK